MGSGDYTFLGGGGHTGHSFLLKEFLDKLKDPFQL
jgi:hypothetical protein